MQKFSTATKFQNIEPSFKDNNFRVSNLNANIHILCIQMFPIRADINDHSFNSEI